MERTLWYLGLGEDQIRVLARLQPLDGSCYALASASSDVAAFLFSTFSSLYLVVGMMVMPSE